MRKSIALVLVLTFCVFSLAANYGRVNVRVLDSEGEPIEGVKITATAPASKYTEERTSDRKGRAKFLALPGGEIVFRFEKEGFQIYEKNYLARVGDTGKLDVELVEFGDAVPEEVAQQLQDAVVLYNEAVASFNAGGTDCVLEKLDQAIEKDPKLAVAHGLRGNVLAKLGKDSEAADAMIRSLDLDASQKSLLPDLVKALEASGRSDEAAKYRQMIEKEGAADPQLAFKLALEKVDAGADDEALALLNTVLSAEPAHAAALFERGMVLLRKGDMEGAKGDLRRYVEVAPDGPRAADAQAMIEALGG